MENEVIQRENGHWVGAPVPAAPEVQSASQELFESQRLKECAAICKHVYNPSKEGNQAVLAAAGVRPITDSPVLDRLRQDSRFQVGEDGSIVNQRNGLKVSLYQDEAGQVTVGIAGSSFGANARAAHTWANNLKAGMGAVPSHDKQAREIVQLCQMEYGPGAVSVTGHSAGGRAAAYASLATGAPALTINADGLGPGYQKDPYIGPKIAGPEARNIVQVRTNHDELGTALKVLPNKLPGSNVNMVGNKGGFGHSMSSVLKSMENPLPERAELVQKERVQGAQVSAEMNGTQAAEIRAFAIMAKDVYNPGKAENIQQRGDAGLTRFGPDKLKELPGLRAKVANSGWQVDDNGTITQPKTGMKAAVYQTQDGRIGVSIAGTEAHLNKRMPTTWMNNIKAGVGFNCQHDKEARDLVMMAQDAWGKKNVSAVGHSAGGRAAAYAALKTEAPGYTFNADGLGPRYQMTSEVKKKLNSLDAQNITQVRTNGDWLKPLVDKGPSKLPGSTVIIAGDGGHGMRAVLNAMESRQADVLDLQRNPAAAQIPDAAGLDSKVDSTLPQGQTAKESLAANPNLIENPAIQMEVKQLQAQIGRLQTAQEECQKKLDAKPSLREQVKSALKIGPSLEEKKQGLEAQIQTFKQKIDAAERYLDGALNEAVAPPRSELLNAAQSKVAERYHVLRQKADEPLVIQMPQKPSVRDMLRDAASSVKNNVVDRLDNVGGEQRLRDVPQTEVDRYKELGAELKEIHKELNKAGIKAVDSVLKGDATALDEFGATQQIKAERVDGIKGEMSRMKAENPGLAQLDRSTIGQMVHSGVREGAKASANRIR